MPGMTRAGRLARLEAKRGTPGIGPAVILLSAVHGEIASALVTGREGFTRAPDESEAAFLARATHGLSVAVFMPENGR